MRKIVAVSLFVTTTPILPAMPAAAQPSPVQCTSKHQQYRECAAPDMRAPMLVMQTSNSPCILNRSWGFNPMTGYIWVANSCGGIFADARGQGYHHGRGGSYDRNSYYYDRRGAVIGKFGRDKIASRHWESDSRGRIRYDHPEIDPRPQFDRNGNPNFDTHGNYIGPHGLGALVDSPDD